MSDSYIFHIILLIVILHFSNIFHIVYTYEYCKGDAAKKLCRNDVHFMCNIEEIPFDAEYLGNVPITRKLRNVFIEKHNYIRNNTAAGDADGTKTPKATAMRELLWDDELAYIAYVHSQRCNMKHNNCHNTVKAPYAGQNLFYQAYSSPVTVDDVINKGFNGWYAEREKVQDTEKMAQSYHSDLHGVGHYTVIINERVAFVGCALAYCKGCGGGSYEHCYYVTCNYDNTNMKDMLIYSTGDESASNCKKFGVGKSTKYKHLCENDGVNKAASNKNSKD